MKLYYGSRGDSVRQLQSTLNSKGYSLDVDGVFGSKTLAAVRDYQSRNNLAVDGIVGTQTYGKLYAPEQPKSGSSILGVSSELQDKLKTPYTPSEQVKSAERAYEAAKNAPAPSMPSRTGLDAAYEAVLNQQPFSYRAQSDPRYAQYVSLYRQLSGQAMEDVAGQAAALTGGYGSTYSQSLGAAAYQEAMQGLSGALQGLYDDAYQRYTDDAARLSQNYQMQKQQYEDDYRRYESEQGARRDAIDEARTQLQSAESLSYQEYEKLLSYYWQLAKAQNSDYRWQREYAMQLGG